MTFVLDALPALALSGGTAAAGAGATSGLTSALQILGLGAGLVGTGLAASGARKRAAAEAEAAEFNAKALEQQAESERDAAQTEAQDFRRRQMRILAERRAAGGATGLAMAGSPLLVEEATIREIALGTARAGHQGMVRSGRLEDEAALSRQRGRNARSAGAIEAGTTLLTGLSQFGRDAATVWG